MAHLAPSSVPAAGGGAASTTKFLVELATTWTLLRLYGTEHPAFRRGAEAAANAIDRPARVSINPRGFTPSPADAPPEMQMLAQRLRAMGLVGLTIEPGISADQVQALVLVLEEADRSRGGAAGRGEVVIDKIAGATGGKLRAVPLRLEGLRLVEGTSDAAATAETSTADCDIWREMFAGAFVSGDNGGGADLAASAELAKVFEAALGGVGGAGATRESKGAMGRDGRRLDETTGEHRSDAAARRGERIECGEHRRRRWRRGWRRGR
jgi:hypothetical protein